MTDKVNNGEQYLTTQQLKDTLNVSRSTIRRLTQAGMPFIWVASQRRYPLEQCLDWLGRRGELSGTSRTRGE